MARTWTITERMMHQGIAQRFRLMRVENQVTREVLGMLRDLERELAGRVVTYLGSNDPDTWLTGARQARLLAQLQRTINEAMPAIERTVERAMREVGGAEADILFNRYKEALAQLPQALPIYRVPEDMLARMVKNYLPRDPSAGVRPVVERLRDLAPRTGLRVQRALTDAVLLGDGAAAAASAVRKVIGPESITAHEAATIARTQLQRVANDSARAFYARNADIVPKVQWVATLDNRTCPLCGGNDGKTYKNGDGPALPAHPQCRCFLTPVLASWRDMGIDPKDASPEIRRLFDGKPAERIGYGDWLQQQGAATQKDVLGATRYEAWKGGAALSSFSREERLLTVAEYKKRAA